MTGRTARREAPGLLLLLVALFAGCGGGGGGRESSPAGPAGGAAAGAVTESDQAPSPVEPLPRRAATLYFPSAESGLLVAESREILATRAAGDRAKQILSDLLSGPTQTGLESAVPGGTKLLQVYVLRDGTAYADFSAELQSAIEPGSDTEILTVYAIINSLTINIPEIDRVGILVDGRPCSSLSGHLDLRRPLRPNWKVVESGSPEESGEPEPPREGPRDGALTVQHSSRSAGRRG